MNSNEANASSLTRMNRRDFFAGAGALAAALAQPATATAQTPCKTEAHEFVTGNGEWTYRVVPDWGQLPTGTIFGGTHGGIATDNAGHVYISTQSATGVLIFNAEGALQGTLLNQYPEVHSLVHAEESGEEFFYATVQKGTPQENWLFLKFRPDGSIIQKITAPTEAGFKTSNEWRLTAAVPAPDGSIFIANGYGDSRLFRFDKKGNYLTAYSGKGSEEGLMNCSHGIAIDTRYDQPLMLICDRENRRLCHFDFDGKFVRTVTQHLRRPCQVSFHGEYAIVSELEGRVTILDKNNAPIAFLGDNRDQKQWANYTVAPNQLTPAIFSAAHGCFIDKDANIYVSDWNSTGRITKLARVNA